MTYRIRNITIAIALALVAAGLTMFYVTNYQRNVRKDETNVQVFVAKVDIPAGLSGADVASRGMMSKSDVVRRAVVPGAISNPAQLATLVSTEPIYAGEQVSTRRFKSPSQQGIRAQLTGVQRAIAIAGNKNQLLAGTLKNGDKIDLVATFGPEGSSINVTRIVLRNIEVLRAPSGAGRSGFEDLVRCHRLRRDPQGHGYPGAEAALGLRRSYSLALRAPPRH